MGTTTAAATSTPPRTGDRVSADEYRRIALDDNAHQWELHEGYLWEKPGMGAEHNDAIAELGVQLHNQLDRMQFRVRFNSGRLHRPTESYYIPDVMVIPTDLERAQRGQPRLLESYDAPLPLVVEVWSPSTGRHDLKSKVPEYQARGDREIWQLHPYERTLRVWRRRPDGGYDEAVYLGGTVRVASLPEVMVDLDALFEG